jgi:uncharacterized membrane protein
MNGFPSPAGDSIMSSGPLAVVPAKLTDQTAKKGEWRPRQQRREEKEDKNVGEAERLSSVVAGAALAAFGVQRRSLSGLVLAGIGGVLAYRGISGRCPCYAGLGISTAKKKGPVTAVQAGRGVRVEKTITINKPPEELYRFWRNLEKLPQIMRHLQSVRDSGDGRSHWVAKGPLGLTVAWDAMIHNERANELIAWRSVTGSDVDTAGSVHFTPAPGGRGTEVRVNLKYDPPAGKVGIAVAKLFGAEPSQEIEEDLRRFKQVMEAGEGLL